MKFNKTPEEARKLLVEALRSGKHKQTTRVLERRNNDGCVIGNCCLGVAVRLFMEYEPHIGIETESITEWVNNELISVTRFSYVGTTTLSDSHVVEWLGFSNYNGTIKKENKIAKELIAKEKEPMLTVANDSGYSFEDIAQIIEDGDVVLRD